MSVSPITISVVIPNYNNADLLPDCLSALMAQSEQPLEILVVDDCSEDDSLDVIARFSERHPIVRTIRHSKNLGAPHALNSGLKAAKGDLILFAGADDFVLPGYLKHASDMMARFPKAALCCAEVALISDGGKLLGFRPHMSPLWQTGCLEPSDAVNEIRNTDNWICGASALYRTEMLRRIGGFETELGSFCDGFAARTLAFKHGFCFVSEVYAVWRRSYPSISLETALIKEKNQDVFTQSKHRLEEVNDATTAEFYTDLFERRWRFGSALMAIYWQEGQPQTSTIMDAISGSQIDHVVISLASGLPLVSKLFSLAWITLRVRPYSLFWVAANTLRRFVRNPLLRRRFLAATRKPVA